MLHNHYKFVPHVIVWSHSNEFIHFQTVSMAFIFNKYLVKPCDDYDDWRRLFGYTAAVAAAVCLLSFKSVWRRQLRMYVYDMALKLAGWLAVSLPDCLLCWFVQKRSSMCCIQTFFGLITACQANVFVYTLL